MGEVARACLGRALLFYFGDWASPPPGVVVYCFDISDCILAFVLLYLISQT